VKIEDAHTKTFKKTCRHVTTLLPHYERYIPGRFKKYLKYAGNETWARRGVALNDGPCLLIVKTETVEGHPYTSNGFFWAKFPTIIHLEERNAAKFEKEPSMYEIGLQYLLLHEMIHWVRHHAKLDADLPGGVEAGDAFEKDAYGRDMSHVWDTGAAKWDRGTIKY
jgi:hypothetical protein